MKYLLLSIFLILSLSLDAQQPLFEWAKQLEGVGGGSGVYNSGWEIETDVFGNVITVGRYSGQIDADPGTGTRILSTNGNTDGFVLKQDTDGNHLWSYSFGGSSFDNITSVISDSSGNVFIGGQFQNTVDFEPGSGQHIYTATQNDGFILKLSAAGALLWVKIFVGQDAEIINALDVDAQGNLYAVGDFREEIDLDPGVGTDIRTNNEPRDVFIVKLDPQGNYVWGRTFGGDVEDSGYDIVVGADNSITTTGRTRSASVDFDPSAGVDLQNNHGDYDIFIHRMDINGNYQWAHMIGGSNNDQGTAVILDTSTNIIVCGKYWGTVDFDPGQGISGLTAGGAWDNFVLKLDAQGQFIWVKDIKTQGMSFDTDVILDANGHIWSFGILSINGDMDPGPGVYILTGQGFDGFLQKMDLDGNFLWAGQFANAQTIRAHAVAADRDGNVFLTGDFKDEGDFDPNQGVHQLTNNGVDEIYIVKLSQCKNTTTTETISACGPYTWIDGNTYTDNNNTATHLLQSAGGCDSLIVLDLTILNEESTDVISSCGPYTWIDGVTYDENNNSATHVLQTTQGCDSTIYLDLTVIEVEATITEINDTLFADPSYDTYQWLNCETNTLIPGATLFYYVPPVTGNYAVIVSKNGCIDTSDCHFIEIPDLSNFSLGADTVLCADETLLLDVSTYGGTFLWQDGSTEGEYLVEQEGQFWVEITNNSGTVRDTIEVSFDTLYYDDFSTELDLCIGEELEIKIGPESQSYLWSDQSTSSHFLFTAPGEYWVEVSNAGCKEKIDFIVAEANCAPVIQMPNVFSSNGDKINDVFTPLAVENISEMQTIIMNRWGNVIFETDNPAVMWTGEGMNEGTYFWVLRYVGTNGERGEVHGTVNLEK